MLYNMFYFPYSHTPCLALTLTLSFYLSLSTLLLICFGFTFSCSSVVPVVRPEGDHLVFVLGVFFFRSSIMLLLSFGIISHPTTHPYIYAHSCVEPNAGQKPRGYSRERGNFFSPRVRITKTVTDLQRASCTSVSLALVLVPKHCYQHHPPSTDDASDASLVFKLRPRTKC